MTRKYNRHLLTEHAQDQCQNGRDHYSLEEFFRDASQQPDIKEVPPCRWSDYVGYMSNIAMTTMVHISPVNSLFSQKALADARSEGTDLKVFIPGGGTKHTGTTVGIVIGPAYDDIHNRHEGKVGKTGAGQHDRNHAGLGTLKPTLGVKYIEEQQGQMADNAPVLQREHQAELNEERQKNAQLVASNATLVQAVQSLLDKNTALEARLREIEEGKEAA